MDVGTGRTKKKKARFAPGSLGDSQSRSSVPVAAQVDPSGVLGHRPVTDKAVAVVATAGKARASVVDDAAPADLDAAIALPMAKSGANLPMRCGSRRIGHDHRPLQ